MKKEFFKGNRERLCSDMKKGAVAVFFSGSENRKTNDEFYPLTKEQIQKVLIDNNLASGNYDKAADSMLNSRYASQVGARATRNASKLRR